MLGKPLHEYENKKMLTFLFLFWNEYSQLHIRLTPLTWLLYINIIIKKYLLKCCLYN